MFIFTVMLLPKTTENYMIEAVFVMAHSNHTIINTNYTRSHYYSQLKKYLQIYTHINPTSDINAIPRDIKPNQASCNHTIHIQQQASSK